MVIYLGDRFLEEPGKAQVSLFDRGYLLGDGVFETLRAIDGRLFLPDRHVTRLLHGARLLELAVPRGPDAIVALATEAAARTGAPDVSVRVTLSRGEGSPGVGITGTEAPTFSIIARPWLGYPPDGYAGGLPSSLVATRRIPAACLPPECKTASYLPSVLARRELDRRGMLEGVMLSVDGEVVSGAVSNVFLVRGPSLVTPHAASGCRPGVTREVLLELAAVLSIPVEERRVEPEELASADELFFANTLMDCLAVSTFDGRVLPGGRVVTDRLRAALRARQAG